MVYLKLNFWNHWITAFANNHAFDNLKYIIKIHDTIIKNNNSKFRDLRILGFDLYVFEVMYLAT